MSSIRTIKIGKAELKWDTGKLKELKYDPKNIENMWRNHVYPNIKDIKEYKKDIIKNLVEQLILDGTINDAQKFVDLALALKLTCFNETQKDIKIYFTTPSEETSIEYIMFWNIPWYINHSVKQTWKYCQVQWYRGTDMKCIGSTWNDADFHDRENGTFEYILESKKKENIETRKKYMNRKK